jgi:hypothetical protein
MVRSKQEEIKVDRALKITLNTDKFFGLYFEIGSPGEEISTFYYLDEDEVNWLSGVIEDAKGMKGKNRGTVSFEYRESKD